MAPSQKQTFGRTASAPEVASFTCDQVLPQRYQPASKHGRKTFAHTHSVNDTKKTVKSIRSLYQIPKWNSYFETRLIDNMSALSMIRTVDTTEKVEYLMARITERINEETLGHFSLEDIVLKVNQIRGRFLYFQNFISKHGVSLDNKNNRVNVSKAYRKILITKETSEERSAMQFVAHHYSNLYSIFVERGLAEHPLESKGKFCNPICLDSTEDIETKKTNMRKGKKTSLPVATTNNDADSEDNHPQMKTDTANDATGASESVADNIMTD